MALLMSFNGCSNGDDTEDVDKQPKSVFLKLGKSGSSLRSVGTPVGDGDDVVLQSGNLYFVNSSGAILKHYTLTTTAASATNINITDAESGALITNLPGNTFAVYVVGNTSGLPSSGNISAVKEYLLQVASQDDIEDVNLYGNNT
ncbi:hypothetical protein, partial [Dysgonomonas mossii]|uniref:hypothetical protein n=1 Tax=Dysgonomonas mossii TaxID=163665 RepID=UPI0026F32918